MRKYKIVIEIETPEKLSKKMMEEICKIYVEDLSQAELFEVEEVIADWLQQFKIEWEDGSIGLTEGKNKKEVEKSIGLINPNKKFKLKEKIK